MGEIEELQAELTQLEGEEKALDSNAREATHRLSDWRHSKDRSFIVRWIIYTYAFSIFSCIAYLVGRGLFCHEDVFSGVSEIIKIAVIPIVTLAIGYYFALSKSS